MYFEIVVFSLQSYLISYCIRVKQPYYFTYKELAHQALQSTYAKNSLVCTLLVAVGSGEVRLTFGGRGGLCLLESLCVNFHVFCVCLRTLYTHYIPEFVF